MGRGGSGGVPRIGKNSWLSRGESSRREYTQRKEGRGKNKEVEEQKDRSEKRAAFQGASAVAA
jgi:hypothetical protein